MSLSLPKYKFKVQLKGSQTRPRIAIFRSLRGIVLQAIDDENGATIVSSRNYDHKISRIERAKLAGEELADKLLALKIKTAVFDKRRYLFHGAVKMAANTLRDKGVKI